MKIKKENTICRRKGCNNECSENQVYEYPKEFCSKKCYDDEFMNWNEDKVIKQVLKQKVCEIGIIPLVVLFLIFIPKWVGKLLCYIFPVLKEILDISDLGIGLLFIGVLLCIIGINIILAMWILENKFLHKNQMKIEYEIL